MHVCGLLDVAENVPARDSGCLADTHVMAATCYVLTRVEDIELMSMQVRGVLDNAEAAAAWDDGWLAGAHVVVGTPACLAAAAAPPKGAALWADVRGVAVDEADACLQVGFCLQNMS